MLGVTAMTYMMYAGSGAVVGGAAMHALDEYLHSDDTKTIKELRAENKELRTFRDKNGHLVYIKGSIKEVNHAQMKAIWGDKYMIGE